MFKKLFALLLTLLMLNFSFLPALAKQDYEKRMTIDAQFVSDFNINCSQKHQVVQFLSTEDYVNSQGILIPKNTLFNGEIKSMKKGRFGFKRAKAKITLKEMVLPNGEKYEIVGGTARTVLKGSALGNTAKGIVCTPIALAYGIVGGAVMLVETVTIIGILLVPPTAVLVGGTMGKMVKGVNYKREKGDEIKIQVKMVSPVDYHNLIQKNVSSEIKPENVPVNQFFQANPQNQNEEQQKVKQEEQTVKDNSENNIQEEHKVTEPEQKVENEMSPKQNASFFDNKENINNNLEENTNKLRLELNPLIKQHIE